MHTTPGTPDHASTARTADRDPIESASGAHSLVADLAAGVRPTTLLFPGIDPGWPAALAEAVLGRPDLSRWVDAIVADLDAWARTPEVRSLGLYADGFAGLLGSGEEPNAVAGTGPVILVGTLLTDLAWLQGLEADGLAPVTHRPGTRAVGHSAGLLAAWLAAGERDSAGLVPVAAAATAARIAALAGAHAARHRWSVSDTAVAAALTGDADAATPMAVVSGPRTERVRQHLDSFSEAHGELISLAVTNDATRHVLSGRPEALAALRRGLEAAVQDDAARRKRGRLGGAPLRSSWQALASSVPFHHPALAAAAQAALDQAEQLGLRLADTAAIPVLDPATGQPLDGAAVTAAVVRSILVHPHDWSGTVVASAPAGTVAVLTSPLGALGGVTGSALTGRGALLVDPTTTDGRASLFTPGRAPAIPEGYERFAPRVVRGADGALRLDNRHTRLTGRSPMILPGMTPTTSEAPIVAAAANGGHVAELAGGGQVSERIFTERVRELTELLEPGQEVVFNALHLDPYLWGLHIGRERLVLKARAAGAPIAGITISAGIPDRAEAVALLDDLVAAGLWLNAFKPGTAEQVHEVLAIADRSPHPLWIHLEGGAAGGHHSWEDLDELLLGTYDRIRGNERVVLAVGGGIADPERAAALLTGTWAHRHGAPTMPVDAVLLGTVTMATLESATSASVKATLAATPGHSGWVTRGEVSGGTTSGRSGLDADIHYLDNAASRAARLLDEVAGDAAAVVARRGEIIDALARTAKPYFGDLTEMTYIELLERFVELTALGRHGRYDDGAWLDPTHRSRFVDLLTRTEARLHLADSGQVPTLFGDPQSVDEPADSVARLRAAHPDADTALLHPADVAHALTVFARPGKPVPFVPVLDADVRRWYAADALWQSHDDRYAADQVLIIPGPTAVAGITSVDEPVASLLDRFEVAVASSIGTGPGGAPERLVRMGASDGSDDWLLTAALAAPTWSWLGAARPNPLHQIAPAQQWTVAGERATWTEGAEGAAIAIRSDGGLTLTLTWPDLGLVGDGSLTLPVEVAIRVGTVAFSVTEQGLVRAGSALLEMFSGGTDAPTDPDALAAAHAATVGGANSLPDRVMTALWPGVFAAQADAGMASAIFDLVHLRHEVLAGRTDARVGVRVEPARITRADAGLIIEVAGRSDDTSVRDLFHVRRTLVDPTLPAAELGRQTDGIVGTPLHTLGRLSIAAPNRLETFATVSGDPNPIHRSDAVARLVGLPGRIVHGMWTSAAATRAVVELAASDDPTRLRSWSMDFLAPVLPGQVVTFTVTRTGLRDGARVLGVEATVDDLLVARGQAEVAPPRTVYVFPGQGIQSTGMGMEGYARSAAARSVWDRADAITRERMGFSILGVVRDNPTSIEAVGSRYRHPAGVLHLTQFTQVAMATLASAQVAELREAGAFDPDAVVAGHSVGEYNALAASSDVLPLEAVVELVFARGQGMHGLVPRDAEGRSDYRLAVIRPHLVGLSHAQAEQLVTSVAADTGQLCEIVNHNLRGKQYAVAGTVRALAELADRLGEGPPGRPALLDVPGIDVPFHSSALRDGVSDFRGHLLAKLPEHIDADALVGRYVPNLYPHVFRLDRDYIDGVHRVCGSPVLADVLADWEHASTDRDALARALLVELLAWQFASPVRWIETVELLCTPVQAGGLGVDRIVEIGVGTAPTLANLARGALALPGHRGTRPEVFNVEVDTDLVFARDADPVPVPVAAPRGEVPVAAVAPGDVSVGDPDVAEPPAQSAGPDSEVPDAPSSTVADAPVDTATALTALLALRVGIRPDQLGDDSVEMLVDGASSRRNQVLMDIGKEFGVPAIDGAHELARADLAERLAERAAGYRYPGPVLSAALDTALTAALGPLGAPSTLVETRVGGHWGLADGWRTRVALALALGTREGASRRGGDLTTVSGESAEALVDAAATAAGTALGVSLTPVAAAAGATTVDAAAVADLRDHVEDLLAEQAQGVLTRLGRAPDDAPDSPDEVRLARATVALLESEHGPAALVAGTFDPRRHVHLASSAAWARADVDHLVESAWRREAGAQDVTPDALAALLDQVVVHRDADARIVAALRHHRSRAEAAGRPQTVALIDRALAEAPSGVVVAGLDELSEALADEVAQTVLTAAVGLAVAPGTFAGQIALVTGASPGSIAWATLGHLLRGGATVVVVTTTDTPERIAAYRSLERRWAAPGAQLHVVRANLASFADVDALVDWLTTPTLESVGVTTREVKPALWPTLVLPFAAAPSAGQVPDTGPDAQVTLRLLLLGVERLVGRLAERISGSGAEPATVILPMSPNHGTFGGDGSYGEAKAALETLLNRWHAEQWGRATRLIAAEIGWVRGTGLMAGNDRLAGHIEGALGVTTFSAEQMGALIAALALPCAARSGPTTSRLAGHTAADPRRVDLSGGLAGRTDLAGALRAALADLGVADSEKEPTTPAQSTIPALPNLPVILRTARQEPSAPVRAPAARIAAHDMVVLVGLAEYGPLGGSATRWQAEIGELTADGVVELAWRTGLIAWDGAKGGWTDATNGESVAEHEVADRYRDEVRARSGVRPLAETPGVAADGSVEFAEVFLDRPTRLQVPGESEPRTLPAGSAVRISRTRALQRSVGGQFPAGSDPTRLGLPAGVAGSMDPLAAWNLVITAEAFADAGTQPEELLAAVHPSLVGNTQGSGMGGMSSIHTLYMAPATGRAHANDTLQEALGNVVSAHVNQSLVGGYGPMVHPVAACATAAVSLEEAVDKIRLGKADIVVGGGWDDLSTEGINGFASMAATADNEAMVAAGLAPDQHSRPGDRRRRGFVESQGGGSFIAVRGSVALALGLPVRAVVGYAASFGDGIHTSIPAPGIGALGSVRGGADSPLGRALAELGLTADDIAVVSKHDTSTEANDPNEAYLHATIQQALGRSPGAPLRVISQKSLTGHSKGGAAAWQMSGVCDVLATGVLPGNRNLVSVDDRVVPDPLVVDDRALQRAEPVRAALVTSLGFGHVSAVVALAHPDVFVAAIPELDRAGYQARAHARRVTGARARLAAIHGGDPVLSRRTDRGMGAGSASEVREREAAMLLDLHLPGAS